MKCPFCGGEGELLVPGGGAAYDDPYQDTVESCYHCSGTGTYQPNPKEPTR